MTLDNWDANVKKHLVLIEAGAEMAARHARALPVRPDFPTLAHDQLQKTREALESALHQVIDAEKTYLSKPVEIDHAA